MKKILLIPTILFPYLILFCMFCIFTGFLMEELFQGFAPVMLIYLAAWFITSLICNAVYIAVSVAKKCDRTELLKINMIVKIAQIPAYMAIFVLGVLCMMTIFTIGFTLFFIIFDLVSVFLSGTIGFGAVMTAKGEKPPQFILLSLSQFVLCIDMPLSIVMFLLSKKCNDNKTFDGQCFGLQGFEKPYTYESNTEVPHAMEKKYTFKPNILSAVGCVLFLIVIVISEIFFADVDDFSNYPVWFNLWFSLSLVMCFAGTVVACIFKNKSNTYDFELAPEAISVIIGLVVMVVGGLSNGSLFMRILFSVGTFLVLLGLSFAISTVVGLLKSPKEKY